MNLLDSKKEKGLAHLVFRSLTHMTVWRINENSRRRLDSVLQSISRLHPRQIAHITVTPLLVS